MCSYHKKHFDSLQAQIASLLVIGFNGHKVDDGFIQSLTHLPHPGGLIAFDLTYDSQNLSHNQVKNIANPGQLERLNACFETIFPESFRSIDSEGGIDWTVNQAGEPARYGVNRLKVSAGFPETQCAYQIGQLYQDGNIDAVKHHYHEIARLLSDLHFNVVYAPVVDIHDARCPIIGAMHRSYSSKFDNIIGCAKLFIEVCREYGVQCCLKHYPGHGSALGDTHLGQVDITQQWSDEELRPFHELACECGMVMMSHVIHRKVDDQPVSLSKRWVERLRSTGFDGVIITDDIQMAATNTISTLPLVEPLADTVLRAFQAGNDMVIVGGQLAPFLISDYQSLLKTLESAVLAGRWSIDDLTASVKRMGSLHSNR